MKSYNITDVEIDTLGLTHWISAVFFSVGTGILSFCFEIKKDLMLIDAKTAPGIALDFSVNNFGYPIAVVFYILGAIAMIYWGTNIRRIKRESEQIES